MKHSLKFALAAGVAMFATSAFAADAPGNNWYLGASGDLTWTDHSDTGGGANLDIGYRMQNVRVEAEAGYHGAPGDDSHSSTHYFSYMGNAYYDFNGVIPGRYMGWSMTPYVGAGIGDAQIHNGNSSVATTFHHHDNEFAYQGMAGLEFASASMPNTDIDLGYRYFDTDGDSPHANNVELGLRYNF